MVIWSKLVTYKHSKTSYCSLPVSEHYFFSCFLTPLWWTAILANQMEKLQDLSQSELQELLDTPERVESMALESDEVKMMLHFPFGCHVWEAEWGSVIKITLTLPGWALSGSLTNNWVSEDEGSNFQSVWTLWELCCVLERLVKERIFVCLQLH